MHQTIDVIVHPDGTIEALEPVPGSGARRALLTILEELPDSLRPEDAPTQRLIAQWHDEGFLETPEEIDARLQPLSREARGSLAQRLPAGTPLSQIIIEEREDRF